MAAGRRRASGQTVRMRRPAVLLAVLATLSLAGAGCGDDDDAAPSTTTTAPSTTTTTAAPPPTTGTTTGGPSVTEPTGDTGDSDETGKSELEDGRHYGFWSTFEIGDTVAFGEFDLAYFLIGADAEAAAAERGDEVNNDYYVVNDNPRLRTLIAKGDTEVLVLTNVGAPDLAPTNVADFAVDRHPTSGFWVTITDGIVTKIEEQFVP